MSTSQQYRAHGKVILLGEHSVVYGHPALAGALADGVVVTARAGLGRLSIPQWKVAIDGPAESDSTLARAYGEIRKRAGEPAIDLELAFNLPTGAGLGSSAAMAVAIGRALGLEGAALAEAAMASETVIHGKPSGLDHTVSLQGGFGIFTRADGLRPVAAAPLSLVIAHTGRTRDTKGRVARVAAIASLVQRGADAVVRGSYGELGAAMNENQRHLEALEVSCPEIERVCAIARDAGAVGAKLTGGGGGGCVIAVAPAREAAVVEACKRQGFDAFVAEVRS